MIHIDMKNTVVLITGGTKGIGLATAFEFAKAGAQLIMTYKWGSADLDAIRESFSQIGAPEPLFEQADVSVEKDTDALMTAIAARFNKIDIFISNVGFALRTMDLESYKKRSLFKTLEYSTWPMIEYSRKIFSEFGAYPKYIIGISSNGPDHFYRGYDFVAASKALLEFFSRYLSVHLFEKGSRVNVLRFGTVQTESFDLIFGEEFFQFLKDEGVSEEMFLTPEECGKAVFAFCSGYLNAVNGQIINIDYGLPFQDNYMMRFLDAQEKAKNG